MSDATLPGLEAPPAQMGALERATRETLEALRVAQLLEPRHAMTCALMVELAQAVEQGRRAGRASAVAMAAAQLREAFETLPVPPDGGGGSDGWDQLATDLREAANRDAAIRNSA